MLKIISNRIYKNKFVEERETIHGLMARLDSRINALGYRRIEKEEIAILDDDIKKLLRELNK